MIHPKVQGEEQKVKDKSEAFVRIVNSVKDYPTIIAARMKAIEERKIAADTLAKQVQEQKAKEEHRRQVIIKQQADRKYVIDNSVIGCMLNMLVEQLLRRRKERRPARKSKRRTKKTRKKLKHCRNCSDQAM